MPTSYGHHSSPWVIKGSASFQSSSVDSSGAADWIRSPCERCHRGSGVCREHLRQQGQMVRMFYKQNAPMGLAQSMLILAGGK